MGNTDPPDGWFEGCVSGVGLSGLLSEALPHPRPTASESQGVGLGNSRAHQPTWPRLTEGMCEPLIYKVKTALRRKGNAPGSAPQRDREDAGQPVPVSCTLTPAEPAVTRRRGAQRLQFGVHGGSSGRWYNAPVLDARGTASPSTPAWFPGTGRGQRWDKSPVRERGVRVRLAGCSWIVTCRKRHAQTDCQTE